MTLLTTVGLVFAVGYGLYCVAFWLAVLYACVAERWCAGPWGGLGERLGQRRNQWRREIEMRQFRSNNERRYVQVVARTPRAVWTRMHRMPGSPHSAGSPRCETP